jgi:hypothetical protein
MHTNPVNGLKGHDVRFSAGRHTMQHTDASAANERSRFELRFQSLFNAGRALAFPCNAQGDVDVKALSERAVQNYLFALTGIGREYSVPLVVPSSIR